MGIVTQASEPLSEREIEILNLLVVGRSNSEIAQELFLTLGTIKWYNRQIFAKLGVSSRTEAVARAYALGLLETNPAPKTLPTSPANLPGTTSAFVGRESELAQLEELIRDKTRLITLLAPGGMGKS